MARVVDRREIAAKGLVADPYALGSVPASLDGQIVPVTDQPGVHLMVREGGVLKPAVEIAGIKTSTKEMMTWIVDYATGVSPPDGTVITTQAEFNALGAPLKFVQDIERVRPFFIEHGLRVKVLAGDQWAMPGGYLTYSGGDRHAIFYAAPITQGRQRPANRDTQLVWVAEGAAVSNGILIYGELADVYTGIAGTWSQNADLEYTFTRSAGSWTPDELKGLFAEMQSGPKAGSRIPIVWNDATSFTLPGIIGSGVGTVDIIQMATRLRGRTFAGDRTSYGILLQGIQASVGYPVGPLWQFRFLDIDEDGDALSISFLQSRATIAWCRMRGTLSWPSYLQITNSRIDIPYLAIDGLQQYVSSPGVLYLSGCAIVGGASTGKMLYLRGGGIGGFGAITETTFKAGPSFTGWLWQFIYGGQDFETDSGHVLLLGNTVCNGVNILPHGGPCIIREDQWINVRNCAQAVSIERGRVQSKAFNAAGFSGNGYNLLVTDADADIPTGLVTAGGTPTYALYLDGVTYTPAQIAALALTVGDSIEGQRGSLVRLK